MQTVAPSSCAVGVTSTTTRKRQGGYDAYAKDDQDSVYRAYSVVGCISTSGFFRCRVQSGESPTIGKVSTQTEGT